jgi:hypothetical protein
MAEGLFAPDAPLTSLGVQGNPAGSGTHWCGMGGKLEWYVERRRRTFLAHDEAVGYPAEWRTGSESAVVWIRGQLSASYGGHINGTASSTTTKIEPSHETHD